MRLRGGLLLLLLEGKMDALLLLIEGRWGPAPAWLMQRPLLGLLWLLVEALLLVKHPL